MAGTIDIKNFTRRSVPRFAYARVAEEVLPGWDISLAFVGPAKARALNKQLRNKDYTPNVLSYAVGDKSGEIIICLSEAAKQAPNYNLPPTTYTLYLFIHGLLHIKGWAHGGRMEQCERKLVAKYGTSNSHRH